MISFLFFASFLSLFHSASCTERDNSFTRSLPNRGRKYPGEHSPRHKIEQQQHRQIEEEPKISIASKRLREDLLENYDKGAFPWEYAWNASNATGFRQGLNVGVGINFHKVFNVDISLSVADLSVWFRQSWIDPRLVWDPLQYDGLDKAYFWIGDGSGSGGETSEIWSPDFELWNQESPLSDTLSDTLAIVDPDGTVFWSRPGHMKPVCKFQGLEKFPFDNLACTMEIGSWAYSGLYLRPTKYNGTGISIGGGITSGEAFSEYSLKNVTAEEHIYPPFLINSEEDWPVLYYYVTFERAWQPYIRGYVLIQIMLNLIGFACFWLPPHCGERMGLAITAMLAAVASELVISENLPLTKDVTWFSQFSMGSTLFATFTLFESVVVIYFHYLTHDDLTPSYIKWFQKSRSNALKKSLNSSYVHGNRANENDAPNTSNQTRHAIDACNNKAGMSSMIGFKSVLSLSTDSASLSDGLNYNNEKLERSSNSVKFSDQEDERQEDSTGRRANFMLNARDADAFKSIKEMKNNSRWQELSNLIDEGARVSFPLIFAVFLAIMFSDSGPL